MNRHLNTTISLESVLSHAYRFYPFLRLLGPVYEAALSVKFLWLDKTVEVQASGRGSFRFRVKAKLCVLSRLHGREEFPHKDDAEALRIQRPYNLLAALLAKVQYRGI